MKIFSIINRIKQELEESPRSKFGGTNKRVVEVDRLLDLLEDLKVVIPEDIRRATGILSEAENTIADAKESAVEIVEQAHQEADTILGQAQAHADGIRADAQAEFDHRVGESEVYKEAFTRASGIAAEAEENATAIYNGARKYADEILVDLQRYLAEYHQMIEVNRKELGVDDITAPVHAAAPVRVAPEPQYAAQAQYMPSQPAASEQPRYPEPAYAEPPRYQEPAYSEPQPPRQARAKHAAPDRYAVEEDPTATRQFARPVSRPMPAEEIEEAPRRRDARVEDAPPKKKGLFSRLLEAEDDDEEEDDEDWEEAPKAPVAKEPKEKKPRKRLIEFIEVQRRRGRGRRLLIQIKRAGNFFFRLVFSNKI